MQSKVIEEDDEDMTQEKFNEMMNVYLSQLAAQPVTWEQDAMTWAQANGLINGNEKGQLMPKRFMTLRWIACRVTLRRTTCALPPQPT